MNNMVTVDLPPYEYKFDEAMKTLRTNLQFCGANIRAVMFTSTVPNEGKSMVTFNVAASLAQMGKRVLLVDADIRKSVLASEIHADKDVIGLSEYLSGQNKIEDVIYKCNIPNLSIIFAGAYAPNPAELLEEEDFIQLVKSKREEYEYVIVDTPPVGTIIDGAIVGKCCDGAVIVIESGAISYKALQKVKGQMEKSGCRILGAVLNKVDVNKGSYYNSYYKGKYGKYRKYGYGEYYGDADKNKSN